ncbi:MAG: ABC transporter, permease protein 2 (cluster 1, maltose/g3p/polyamine/iron), partial [uncultured Thermomicrobiales bacterium]
ERGYGGRPRQGNEPDRTEGQGPRWPWTDGGVCGSGRAGPLRSGPLQLADLGGVRRAGDDLRQGARDLDGWELPQPVRRPRRVPTDPEQRHLRRRSDGRPDRGDDHGRVRAVTVRFSWAPAADVGGAADPGDPADGHHRPAVRDRHGSRLTEHVPRGHSDPGRLGSAPGALDHEGLFRHCADRDRGGGLGGRRDPLRGDVPDRAAAGRSGGGRRGPDRVHRRLEPVLGPAGADLGPGQGSGLDRPVPGVGLVHPGRLGIPRGDGDRVRDPRHRLLRDRAARPTGLDRRQSGRDV